MTLEKRKPLTFLLFLAVFLAVACTQTANGAAKPTLVSVLLLPTATSTPIDHVEPEPPVTATTGTDSSVAQLPPTPWPETGLPIIGQLGPSPIDECVVYQNGQVRDEDLPYVYAEPSTASAVIGQLGRNRWANGLKPENDWIEIIVGPSVTGWVLQTAVSNNGQCAGSNPPPPALPLIMNRGAPANERCVVINPKANVDLVNVYAAPDLQAAPVAQLGNWADVLQISAAWYEILIPQGGTGWVQAEHVTPAASCAPGAATPVP